ncbi:MAG: YHYH domain-containing protein [Methylococcales bacterium]
MTLKRKIISWVVCLTIICSNSIYAHSGGTNSDGCHNDNINGGYHCHISNNSSSSSEDADGILLIVLAVGFTWWLLSNNNYANSTLSEQPRINTNNFKLKLTPTSEENLDGVVLNATYAF